MDAYDVLGIPRNSTDKQIREKYLSLARQHHPDKHQNSIESIKKFQDIESAYRQIIDPSSFKGPKPKPTRSKPPPPPPKPPPPKPPPPKPPPPPPKPPPPPVPKFKKSQNLGDLLNEFLDDGRKKTGKKKDRWS